jgi:hypothetical protein
MHAPSFRRICWTYHSCCLIAVAICEDPWYRITRDAVQEAVGRRLEIPQGDVVVDFFPPQGFLLLLPEPGLRDRALSSNGGLAVGRAKLQLLPWMRKAGAEAAKLPFRVRLCIEGLPPHARRESGNSCLKLRCSRASTVATAVTARLAAAASLSGLGTRMSSRRKARFAWKSYRIARAPPGTSPTRTSPCAAGLARGQYGCSATRSSYTSTTSPTSGRQRRRRQNGRNVTPSGGGWASVMTGGLSRHGRQCTTGWGRGRGIVRRQPRRRAVAHAPRRSRVVADPWG